jgi:hypothetical protein
MNRPGSFESCLALAAAIGIGACGDDGGALPDSGAADAAPGDAGAQDRCENLRESVQFAPEQLSGPCCARTDNDPANPTFRVGGLAIESPGTLANVTVRILLASALDEERFNWGIELQDAGTDGSLQIRTGFVRPDGDGSYSFAMDDAPEPGDAARWNPATLSATLSGEVLSTAPASDAITVPLFTLEGELDTELPLSNLELTMATMSENRNCIGSRGSRSWDTEDAELVAYIPVEEAKAAMVNIDPINTTLCKLIASLPRDDARPCDEIPRSEWESTPDSLCNAEGSCSVGGCDPLEDCNAWQLSGGFAAHSVRLAP